MLWLIIGCIIFGLIGYAIGKNKEVGSGIGLLLGFMFSLLGIVVLLCLKNKRDAYDDQLLKWNDLKDKGAITEEEFERMKNGRH